MSSIRKAMSGVPDAMRRLLAPTSNLCGTIRRVPDTVSGAPDAMSGVHEAVRRFHENVRRFREAVRRVRELVPSQGGRVRFIRKPEFS